MYEVCVVWEVPKLDKKSNYLIQIQGALGQGLDELNW